MTELNKFKDIKWNKLFMKISRNRYKNWMKKNYPKFKDISIDTFISDSLIIERVDLGISLEQMLLDQSEEMKEKYINSLANHFGGNIKKSTSRAKLYYKSTQYLIKYLKETKQLPRPTIEIIHFYLEKWKNSRGYEDQEKGLKKIFIEKIPENKLIEDILIKAGILNYFYNTNIFNIYNVVRHYLTIKIDEKLKNNDESLVADLVDNPFVKIKFYSFATKYCSHHKPNDYPIYDSLVDEILWNYKKTDNFADFTRSDFKNFVKFKSIIIEFQKYYGLTQFSFKEIDQFLWQIGKDFYRD